jgi:hypothetical protein
MKKNVPVACVCSAPNCCDTEQRSASQPGSVASGHPILLLQYIFVNVEFCVHVSVHHKSMYLEDQQYAVLSSLYYTTKSLYMFRVSDAPIIRNKQTVVTATGTSHEFEDVVIKSV